MQKGIEEEFNHLEISNSYADLKQKTQQAIKNIFENWNFDFDTSKQFKGRIEYLWNIPKNLFKNFFAAYSKNFVSILLFVEQ